VLNLLYFYISTFRSMCAVPNMAVFCSSLTSLFHGMLLTYFLNAFEIVPVAPIITGITFVFTFHMRCISIGRSLYYYYYYYYYYYWTQLPQLMPKSSFALSGSLLVLAVIYFFPRHNDYICANVLTVFKLRNLHERKHTLRALFTYFLEFQSFPSWMDSIGLRVPTLIIRGFL